MRRLVSKSIERAKDSSNITAPDDLDSDDRKFLSLTKQIYSFLHDFDSLMPFTRRFLSPISVASIFLEISPSERDDIQLLL